MNNIKTISYKRLLDSIGETFKLSHEFYPIEGDNYAVEPSTKQVFLIKVLDVIDDRKYMIIKYLETDTGKERKISLNKKGSITNYNDEGKYVHSITRLPMRWKRVGISTLHNGMEYTWIPDSMISGMINYLPKVNQEVESILVSKKSFNEILDLAEYPEVEFETVYRKEDPVDPTETYAPVTSNMDIDG